MKLFDSIGVQIPQILLPKAGVNLTKWAVIACDQFTSQPEYWERVESFVGDAPSTLSLVFPEVYLECQGEMERIQRIQAVMDNYLSSGMFEIFEGLLLVERWVNGRRRSGIMLALDLEKYDYREKSQSLIRATEGTIIERLPARIKIRQGASLELPHILVLIDDPEGRVIEPVRNEKKRLRVAYDFDLMFNSGHLSGYRVDNEGLESRVIEALNNLADSKHFAEKYGVKADQNVLLFAIGDGNHSLAAAKTIWEQMKPRTGMDHPARYALVEIENVHDEGLRFAPIHRLLFGLKEDLLETMQSYWAERIGFRRYSGASAFDEMRAEVDKPRAGIHAFGVFNDHYCGVAEISHPSTTLPVGTLQAFLDDLIRRGRVAKVDYVHGEEILRTLGNQEGNAGFYLPMMDKNDLFKTVILDGALPRKSFSMGEAYEKRFYLESRKIKP